LIRSQYCCSVVKWRLQQHADRKRNKAPLRIELERTHFPVYHMQQRITFTDMTFTYKVALRCVFVQHVLLRSAASADVNKAMHAFWPAIELWITLVILPGVH